MQTLLARQKFRNSNCARISGDSSAQKDLPFAGDCAQYVSFCAVWMHTMVHACKLVTRLYTYIYIHIKQTSTRDGDADIFKGKKEWQWVYGVLRRRQQSSACPPSCWHLSDHTSCDNFCPLQTEREGEREHKLYQKHKVSVSGQLSYAIPFLYWSSFINGVWVWRFRKVHG
jgi:hypothetical protein